MRKAFTICLTLVLVVMMATTSFAAYVSSPSPSGNTAPKVEAFSGEGTLNVTAFGDKSELPAELLELFEKAHNDIVSTDDLTTLNADFAKLVADKKLTGADLAVSDLFDLHASEEQKGSIEITLEADTLKYFVGLLHLTNDGWELVKDAKVINKGTQLKFSVDSLSPFAIVVDTSGTVPEVPTGDDSHIHVYAIIMAAAAMAIVLIAVKTKKQSV